MIQCKRVYDAVDASDGRRVLVDRLWPRGVRKDALVFDAWLQELAPSTALRQRFAHVDERFNEFRRRYWQQLNNHPEHWMALLDIAERGTLTLLYAAKDTQHNNAQVLAEFLQQELDRRDRPSSPVCYGNEL
ncbi:DUF488 domain-containing protein [Pseudomonas sp. M30-35]|uniref:DUF488 domain-containing protein n=1 Tax=Pseudomonas sp. M30-35 TaxID=1981174 RepID=UPI000B3D0B15|nr:DUF488 domain-containing protein [Pseudomonas sp. M30-35]ARU89398.1 MarR family transcriptional regulator [Pseudomonas sp. M30-35]